MLSSDNNGLLRPFGNGFPCEDDLLLIDQGERTFPSLSIVGTGNLTSPNLLPPSPVILPDPRFLQLEKFKVTQALLACKHLDGNSVCGHVLKIKSHIDRLGMLGVIFPKELAVGLVLHSLPESYGQFIKCYYMTDQDVILIEPTYLLIVVEAEMLKCTCQANMFEGSVSQTSVDNDNGNIGSPEKVSLPNGKGSAKVKPFDHMVKRKANSEIVQCAILEYSICFYCQLNGHWMRSFPVYLKVNRDSKVKLYDSTSGSMRKKEA
ncbi:hypothetical protein Lser_V15G32502 [Lactuca serriola]